VVLALTLLAAACGDDDEGDAAPSTTTQAVAEAGTTTTAAGGSESAGGSEGSSSGIQFSETNQYAQDVDRSGETITIGLSNDEGGVVSLPEFRVGAEVAADYINDHGGINGAKVKLSICESDASPEGAVSCANRFVEEGVDIASYGIELAIDAALPVYRDAGIPLITPAAYGAAQRVDPNAASFGAAAGAYTAWPLQALKDLGATNVAFITQNSPSVPNFLKLLEKWAPEIGIKVSSTNVLDPASPDYTAAVQAAASDGADAIWAFVPEPSCIQFVNATNQLAYDGLVMAGTCSQFIEVIGDAAEGTLTHPDVFLPDIAAAAPPHIQKNLALYGQVMRDAGHEDLVNSVAALTFAFMFDLKTALETIPEGPINAQSVLAAIHQDRWLPSFNGPDFNCGAKVWAAEPSYCRSGLLMVRVVKRNGELVREPIKTEDFGFYNDPALAARSDD
jgi:branched-chain amino acid transport system substrate-binding protein